jgi:hypothetical protein
VIATEGDTGNLKQVGCAAEQRQTLHGLSPVVVDTAQMYQQLSVFARK